MYDIHNLGQLCMTCYMLVEITIIVLKFALLRTLKALTALSVYQIILSCNTTTLSLIKELYYGILD